MSKKTSEISIKISLDEDKRPEKIVWQADDHPEYAQGKDTKAVFLALFDPDTKETLKLDLWTKEFQVGEMDRFIYYTLRSMADTYIKATNNRDLASAMQQFAQYFGEQTEIISSE